MDKSHDKTTERNRYDKLALSLINGDAPVISINDISPELRAPYSHFEEAVGELTLDAGSRILEIGAGTGALTSSLLKTGSLVTASDISETSLQFLFSRLASLGNLQTATPSADLGRTRSRTTSSERRTTIFKSWSKSSRP